MTGQQVVAHEYVTSQEAKLSSSFMIMLVVYTQTMNPERSIRIRHEPETFESGTQNGNTVSGYLRIRIRKRLANPNILNVMNLKLWNI